MPFTNDNPKKRRFAILEVDQNTSVALDSMITVVTKKEISIHFQESSAIDQFYANPDMINHTMILCLYTLLGSTEKRRRILITTSVAEEDIKKDMILAAESVGVYINFHEIEVSSTVKNVHKNQSKIIKVHRYFFYTLIEYFNEAPTHNFDLQVNKVREELLTRSVHEKEDTYVMLGTLLESYLEYKDNIYVISNLFGQHLRKADVKINTKYLPKTDKTFLFDFPFNFMLDNAFIRSALVKIRSLKSGNLGLSITCPRYLDNNWDGTLFNTSIDISSSDNIEKSLKKNEKFISNSEEYCNLVTYCLKCLLYIHSAEPNLSRDNAAITAKKNPVKMKKFYKQNMPFNITTVGYSFHVLNGGKEFIVSGHFRWQPCGVDLSLVKLIWIDAYSKNKDQN